MTANAALYVPLDFFPSRAQLEPLAPDAYLEVDDYEQVARLKWKGLSVQLKGLPRGELPGHLQGFVGYAKQHGANPALETRLLHTRAVYGCVIEPDFDAQGRVMRLLGGITDAAGGLCFVDGEIFGPGGQELLLGGQPLLPPSPERVRARAQALLALALRGLLEDDTGTADQPKAEALRQNLWDWAEETLGDELEPEEAQFLSAPLGEPERQLIVDAVWRAEGAQVLLWALGARPLPAHDAQEHPYEVARASGVMAELPAVLRAPRLEQPEGVEAKRKVLMGVHWRLRELGVRPGPMDFVKFAKSAWFGAFSLDGVALAGGDLAVGGAPLSKADPERVSLATSIAHERHLAANWLIGVNPVYSAVNTPT